MTHDARGRTASGVRPDLVVGLVAPVGVRTDLLVAGIRRAFMAVRYETEHLQLSELLAEAAESVGVVVPSGLSRYERLMTLGTELRKLGDDGAVVALLAVRAMWLLREDRDDRPYVFILRSLKHPDEAEVLNDIYGSRFLLIGATADRHSRIEQVRRRLMQEDRWTQRMAEPEAIRLVNKDEAEPAEDLGQHVRDVFHTCDAFVRVSTDEEGVRAELERLVRYLFGYPFATPSEDELGMFHAYAVSLRSSALGRQVGCAIIDDDGEVIVTGMNDVARAGGGQYWAGNASDGRDFRYGHEPSDHYNIQLVHEILTSLRSGHWLSDATSAWDEEELVQRAIAGDGPLSGARVLDVLEFGRVVHAEMAALMTAARRGTSVRGGTLFTTTFPCHECARHIVAAGLRRVVYLDPYPKSRVADLYSDSIDVDGGSRDGRIPFEPFVGVAPKLFERVFEMRRDKMRKIKGTGALAPWDGGCAGPLLDAADVTGEQLMWTREQEAAERAVGILTVNRGARATTSSDKPRRRSRRLVPSSLRRRGRT